MIYTSNLNLRKPEGADYYNVEDFNANADLLDAAVTGKAGRPGSFTAGNLAALDPNGNLADSGASLETLVARNAVNAQHALSADDAESAQNALKLGGRDPEYYAAASLLQAKADGDADGKALDSIRLGGVEVAKFAQQYETVELTLLNGWKMLNGVPLKLVRCGNLAVLMGQLTNPAASPYGTVICKLPYTVQAFGLTIAHDANFNHYRLNAPVGYKEFNLAWNTPANVELFVVSIIAF